MIINAFIWLVILNAVGVIIWSAFCYMYKGGKRAKMSDYDLGMLHGSEGREPQKNSQLYLMGYKCRVNLSNLQTNK